MFFSFWYWNFSFFGILCEVTSTGVELEPATFQLWIMESCVFFRYQLSEIDNSDDNLHDI